MQILTRLSELSFLGCGLLSFPLRLTWFPAFQGKGVSRGPGFEQVPYSPGHPGGSAILASGACFGVWTPLPSLLPWSGAPSLRSPPIPGAVLPCPVSTPSHSHPPLLAGPSPCSPPPPPQHPFFSAFTPPDPPRLLPLLCSCVISSVTSALLLREPEEHRILTRI